MSDSKESKGFRRMTDAERMEFLRMIYVDDKAHEAYRLEESKHYELMSNLGVFFSDAKNLRNKVTSCEVKLEHVNDKELLVAASVISLGCFYRVLIYGLLTSNEILFIMQKINNYLNDSLSDYCSLVMKLLTNTKYSKYLESVKAAIHDIRFYVMMAEKLDCHFKWEIVPEEFLTPELFIHAGRWKKVDRFYELMKDPSFCLSVVEKTQFALSYIPQEFHTEELNKKYDEKWDLCFSSD